MCINRSQYETTIPTYKYGNLRLANHTSSWIIMRACVGLLVLSFVLAVNASTSSRIVGGSVAPKGKYPYQVSLWLWNKRFHCSGSIINEYYILTAAHCIYSLSPHELTIRAGTNDLDEPATHLEPEELIAHEGYLYSSNNDDIGLIKLAKKIVFTDNIQPVALPTKDFTKENHPVMLSGWGRLYARGPIPRRLQEIELNVINTKECKRRIRKVSHNQICTLTRKGEGACNGDSGGPLVVDGVEIGIVSFGRPCARGWPDVYTRVYAYIDWIAENMEH